MKRNERVLKAIYDAVDEVNKMLPENQQLTKAPDTIILDGDNGKLDSLGLINFTVATEEKVGAEFGTELSLTEANIFTVEPSPLVNIGALTDFISSVLEVKGIG